MSDQLNRAEIENDNSERKITSEGLKKEIEGLAKNTAIYSESLSKIMLTTEKIKKIKENDIRFADPILRQNDNAIIFPHTINVIQGQAGVHKSRLAEFICAAMLKRNGFNKELLGYKRENFEANNTVVYVDTERNQSEQFPYALQCIQINAGYDKKEHPENFKYISLLEITRKERFTVLDEYLKLLKQETENPLFIVLDVSTDCIEDFNKTDKSMELIDLMNVAINEHNVVFLCLIHENPKSEKARGHFGTELMNKASTVIQVSYEKDAKQIDTNLIKIRYLKCRSTARHEPFFALYSEEQKGLILASKDDIQEVMSGKKQKADLMLVCEHLEMYLGDYTNLTRRDLLDKLIEALDASEKTIEDRLKEIFINKTTLFNQNGQECYLEKDKSEKVIRYFLCKK
uniref:hypothetical protein n=1 Tax=Gelidibacter sp. TaxID=2018083 RepID=UPI0040494950